MSSDSTAPRDIVAEAEADDAQVTGASSGPIDEQDMAAADGLEATDEQAAHYREMLERGAAQKGEGALP